MEFNRLVSLVLGFIVLILLFVWISNQFRSNTKTVTVNGKEVTVTPSPTATPKPEEKGGWNPFGFLFNRGEETPTPTPTATEGDSMIARLSGTVTTTPVQVRVIEGESTQNGTETTGGTVTYKNNAQGQAQNQPQKQVNGVQQIPETGAASALLPISLSLLTAGMYLRKRA